jgi:hypothetical protein
MPAGNHGCDPVWILDPEDARLFNGIEDTPRALYMHHKANIYLFISALLCCLVQTSAFGAGDCEFSIKLVEARYDYVADFYITVTNKTDRDILMKHFDGPPFEFVSSTGYFRFTISTAQEREGTVLKGSF